MGLGVRSVVVCSTGCRMWPSGGVCVGVKIELSGVKVGS